MNASFFGFPSLGSLHLRSIFPALTLVRGFRVIVRVEVSVCYREAFIVGEASFRPEVVNALARLPCP